MLAACGGSKNWTYTRSIHPVFLDDSTAAVFLVDYTETERFMESPRISRVAIRGYRVNYRTQEAIIPYTGSMPAGDLGYGPDFSLTRNLLFITGQHYRHPFIAIDWKTGKVKENNFDICCARRLDDWWDAGRYFFLSDSGSFHVLDLPKRKLSTLDADTLFRFNPELWFDLKYAEDLISASFASGDSLWLADMRMSDRVVTRIPLPPPPVQFRNATDLEVTFGPNSGYLRMGHAGGGGVGFMIPLRDLRSATGLAAWVPEAMFNFNQDLTVKAKWLWELDSGPIDSNHVVFLDLNDKVLADYDFSSHIRK